jgi:hypothetical protein
MPNYISKLLHTIQHPTPAKPQHSPHTHIPIKYGAASQLAIDPPPLASVSDKEIKYVQQVVGSLLYYSQAVDSTLLTALSSIAAKQTQAMSYTIRRFNQILYYVTMHPNACLTFSWSSIQLVCHSNILYLSVSNVQSWAWGHYFLSSPPD